MSFLTVVKNKIKLVKTKNFHYVIIARIIQIGEFCMEIKEDKIEAKSKSDSSKKNSDNYISTTIYLPKEINDTLRLMALSQGLTKSSYITKSVNEQIRRDSLKDNESKNLIEIKKMGQELKLLIDNIDNLTADFNLLKSAVMKALGWT